ncbi:MAG: T9SS type A sorting domain-containing protein, partial [Bacteroidales bacterium]|nr:T9SS type A sorting domain-containing protein [Bacteroidales bacterium]
KKMKKNIITLIAVIIAVSATAQNNQLTYPATYVETVVDAATLQELSREFSVVRVKLNADNSFSTRISLSYKDFDNFLSKQIPYTTYTPTRANVRMAQNYDEMVTNWNRYPTYSTYLALMDTFQTRYPQLCKIDTILAATPDNHSILCAHISNNLNDNEGKPSIFYTSTIHGDEVVGYYMMLRLIDLLLTNYSTDTYITELVNNVDIWICPLHNPDGTYFASDDQINNGPISIRYNHNWEDLNRVFPEIDPPVTNDSYEPEVEAMMQFMEAHNFTLAANLHGGAEVFNYPWDSWTTWQHSHADANWWEYVGHNFADTCHLYSATYMTEENNGVTEGGDWYVITGSMQDYHNWYLGTRHVTIEVCEDKVLSSNLLPNYWSYAQHSFLNFIAEADNGIHGTVTDSLTGEPLQALIYIANHDFDHSYVETTLPHGDYHRPIKAGLYTVTYSAEGYLPKTIITAVSDGEKLVQNVQLSQPVGIAEHERTMVVYPNPAHDFLTVELADGTEIDNITLYDIQGRLVGRDNYSPLPSGIFKLDVRNLPAGTYILHIRTTNNYEIVRKVHIL